MNTSTYSVRNCIVFRVKSRPEIMLAGPSTIERCSRCTEEVWLSDITRKQINEEQGKVRLICMECFELVRPGVQVPRVGDMVRQ